jgi:hypothetical protein
MCSVEISSAKPGVPEFKTGGFGNSKSLDELDEIATDEPENWRTPLIRYLENPSHIIDRKVWWQALKYVLLDHNLYRRTIDSLLLKCLGLNQSNKAMGEVHEVICGTH